MSKTEVMTTDRQRKPPLSRERRDKMTTEEYIKYLHLGVKYTTGTLGYSPYANSTVAVNYVIR